MSSISSALQAGDETFDPASQLLQRPALTPGYHTKLAAGTSTHPTRESMNYALLLLETDETWRHERARTILTKMVDLQVKDPTSTWFGLWGWFLEEPPHKMAPADWNWADFIGARLVEIIARFPDRLPPDLLAGCRNALSHAGWCIFRRNVRTDYTNICAMGAAVCLAAGELLEEPLLLAYGLERLRNLRKLLEIDGGFTEYNSSTYTLVALIEFERILGLVRNTEARAEAETLLYHTWRLISGQFHPGTGQWAGPACRSYNDWLDEPKLQFLEERLGFKLVRRPGPKIGFFGDAFLSSHPRPCPEDIRSRFQALPSDPLTFKNCWVRALDGSPRRVSTTWFSEDATLGSMNQESAWNQSRVVLGYMRSPEDPAVRLRLRVLHDGRDFSGSFIRNDQEGPRILSSVQFIIGQGDFHPTLDRPPEGTYRITDLRLRYEIEGHGVKLEKAANDLFLFTTGSRRLAIRTGPGFFDGKPVADWETGRDGDLHWLDFVFYAGPERPFNPGTIGETCTAVALELLGQSEAPSAHSISTSTNAPHRTFSWQSDRAYTASIPLQAEGLR